MASPLDRTQGFFEWVSTGHETYARQDYRLSDAILNLSDSDAVRKNGKWNPLPLVDKENLKNDLRPANRQKAILALKWLDVVVQVFTGTLIFGLLQALTELARAFVLAKRSQKNRGMAAVLSLTIANGLLILLGLIARIGSFVTHIFAAALRVPLAIVSGIVGFFWGLVDSDKSSPAAFVRTLRQAVADFLWPFAPMVHKISIIEMDWAPRLEEMQRPSMKLKPSRVKEYIETAHRQTLILMLSLLIALTIVLLLATGTFGFGGLTALPLLNLMINTIATGLNGMLGWVGFHVVNTGAAVAAHSAGFSSLPILSGIASFLGMGKILTSLFIGASLFGAIASGVSQTLRCVTSNTIEYTHLPLKPEQHSLMKQGEAMDYNILQVVPSSSSNAYLESNSESYKLISKEASKAESASDDASLDHSKSKSNSNAYSNPHS